MEVPRSAEFTGTARFAIQRRLGAGGMGVVYQAWDRQRNVPVALKTLRDLDAAAIYRLKREFRALSDVVHPNLVVLHELVSEGDQWFITMELVDGVDLLSWVRPGATMRAELPTAPVGHERGPQAPPLDFGVLDEARLREALGQLAEGLSAIHAAGRLHRDVKPSNVIVARDGRAVLLDFGLATEIAEERESQSTEQQIVGTAAYMAPEQAAMEPCTAAADWYAVGVLLFEALTGRLPFRGSQLQILMNKQSSAPPSPLSLAPHAPTDLCELCLELLRVRPEDRPKGRDVLRRLGRAIPARKPLNPLDSTSAMPAPVVGQGAVTAKLSEAFADVRQGRTVAMFLHGQAGAGTTLLARRFVDQIQRETDAVVLAGRCYERESVPYNALDSLVDALSRFLRRLPRLEVDALMPRDVHALARMFPVLRRVEAVASAPLRGEQSPDPQELRNRAAAALRELLARLADRRPLVLFIDALQWGDSDSAAILAEILRPPDGPALLLIAGYRTEDGAASAPLQQLKAALRLGCDVRELTVPPLSDSDARSLAEALLLRASLPPAQAIAIAHESRGNPFFVYELVRYLQLADTSITEELSLEQVIRARTSQLPEGARRLLEIVAIAGGPVSLQVAERAAELDPDDRGASGLLRAAHLVRTAGEGEQVETYHDRIRETVIARLAADDLPPRHRRLAQALEASGRGDPEALALHYRAAGEPERASVHASAAALRASEALAFDRAAALHRLALELRPLDAAWTRTQEVLLANALANAGRGAEAAAAYLAAANRQDRMAAEALDLRRHAAEQLLLSGHIDEGLDGLEAVLGRVGMRVAASPRRALLSLVTHRARVRLRGLKFVERDASQVSAEELTRVDACWTGAVGLGMVDTIRGSAFQARYLLLALETGEPRRIALALAAEACFVATPGESGLARARELLVASEQIATRLDDARSLGFVAFSGALVAFLNGHWRQARELSERADRIFRERCTGVSWELSNARLFSLWSLFYLGEVAELSRRVPELLREARVRGDRYGETSFRTGLTSVAHLVRDDTDAAEREAQEVMGQWSRRGFHFQHYWTLLAQSVTDLYSGQGRRAHERLLARWPELKSSLLLRIQNVRVEATHIRARSALAALGTGLDDRALLQIATADAKALEKEKAPWAAALALLIRAGLAMGRGETTSVRWLEEAEERLTTLQMTLFAAAARYRRGQLLGDEGRPLVAAAEAVMRAQGIANPLRMTALLTPGG